MDSALCSITFSLALGFVLLCFVCFYPTNLLQNVGSLSLQTTWLPTILTEYLAVYILTEHLAVYYPYRPPGCLLSLQNAWLSTILTENLVVYCLYTTSACLLALQNTWLSTSLTEHLAVY